MPLSWNEIRRRTVASFEEPVRKLSRDWGRIDQRQEHPEEAVSLTLSIVA